MERLMGNSILGGRLKELSNLDLRRKRGDVWKLDINLQKLPSRNTWVSLMRGALYAGRKRLWAGIGPIEAKKRGRSSLSSQDWGSTLERGERGRR